MAELCADPATMAIGVARFTRGSPREVALVGWAPEEPVPDRRAIPLTDIASTITKRA